MISLFCWRLSLQLVNTSKHLGRSSSLLTGLFCKGEYYISDEGMGCWYNKNSESVAGFMIKVFLKTQPSHLVAGQIYPCIDLNPHGQFYLLVLMSTGFLCSSCCCCCHLRLKRNVPRVGNSVGFVGFSQDNSVLAAHWVVSCLLANSFSFSSWELWLTWEFLETLLLPLMITAVTDKVEGGKTQWHRHVISCFGVFVGYLWMLEKGKDEGMCLIK